MLGKILKQTQTMFSGFGLTKMNYIFLFMHIEYVYYSMFIYRNMEEIWSDGSGVKNLPLGALLYY